MENILTETLPDERGRFGSYGGKFIPETLMAAAAELEQAYNSVKGNEDFQLRLAGLLASYVGRPTPLYYAENLSRHLGGAKIYLKREDLAHTGAHKINNALGQALLAQRMGKRRIIAETGAGQHGVAAATACAMLGMQCIVYMGEEDIRRQSLNVYRMRLLEAEVIAVASGTRTLKDAINEAIRDWVTNVETTHYLIGSVVGPHPYPVMVRDFQCVIGREAREQIWQAEGRLPDYVMACVGGGSNAIGTFHPFVADEDVQLVGLEAGGKGLDTGEHSATLTAGRPGVLHGAMTYLLQDADGQVSPAHSISAGLDYPGVRPRTQLPEGLPTRPVSRSHRRAGVGSLPPALPHRGHYPGAGVGPCRLRRGGTGPQAAAGQHHTRLSQRPRRQGYRHRGRGGEHPVVILPVFACQSVWRYNHIIQLSMDGDDYHQLP